MYTIYYILLLYHIPPHYPSPCLGHSFPLELPEYYTRIANFKHNNRKTALTKLTKILYYTITIDNTYTEGSPITITPPKLDDNTLFMSNNSIYPGYNGSSSEVAVYAVEIALFFQV